MAFNISNNKWIKCSCRYTMPPPPDMLKWEQGASKKQQLFHLVIY